MRKLLKLVPDVPVEIALGCAEGVNVVSPRGTPAVKYTLVDGRTFYATQYVNAKFKEMGIGANEQIALCQRNVDGKTITEVIRVSAPILDDDTSPPPNDHPLPTENLADEPVPNQPEIANRNDSPRPVTQLENALKTAIFSAHMAEQYGKEIGYVVRFDQESVKCMALTVLIGMQGGRN